MSETPLNVRPITGSKYSSKPIPTPSLLKPWEFDYSPAPSGQKDINLLIMFHGMGDTKTPFAKLGKSLNLAHTAVLSLQAPNPIPFLESPSHYSWYNTFDPYFNLLPNPDPSPTLKPLRKLLETLTSKETGWEYKDIHLFGWGQGGSMALELAYSLGKDRSPRLGSVISICAGLLSFPTGSMGIETPCLYFSRQNPKSAVREQSVMALERAFKELRVVGGDPKGGESMPKDRSEWLEIMRFWSEVLGREESWKGEGEIYEVVR